MIVSSTGYTLRGRPYMPARTKSPSINCDGIPQFLSPTLHITPDTIQDKEALIRNRHLDLLVNAKSAQVVRARSYIIQAIRAFLLNDDFIEVQTPMIADTAGGAVAKSFKTYATEFPDKELALRIAPELWLKRLIIGGMARVFEIGPAFRNEVLPEIPASLHMGTFQRIEFIPAIEEGLGEKLPDLAADDATSKLISLFDKHSIPTPSSPTLPRLLDKLGTTYIEPQCEAPTFIMYHPACMAPLAKSFHHPGINQNVSARAELFIQQREIANMYEEENSPIEQRTKMELQARYRDAENDAHVDQGYIEALEWGLPPTGGWGCGVDRLVMLFTGCTRIADVLPFGNLRNVVNLGSPAPRTSTSKSSLTETMKG
ncbi:putative Lysyl-tRNA synthetase, mitochondrial [Glarea lozoyensis 74030]|uniref:Putative Lysyl-tRNA synthetase, mitochondrial n=1 Tax=Glarea lozoyensis (strain ATCC 74030 / MF5533) TaxID=1104152 RepID=H0EZ01_GLAL7|nr:putative Lysyl-tRNA synthetase, mitochondrial [Glarea lozoyensis 74030]